MGESIAEGTLSKWLKKVGDEVKRDEPIFEISTDKVDAEIPAPAAGVLAEIMVKEGETVAVQTVVARLETEKGAAAGGGRREAGMLSRTPVRLSRRRQPHPLSKRQPRPQRRRRVSNRLCLRLQRPTLATVIHSRSESAPNRHHLFARSQRSTVSTSLPSKGRASRAA